MAVQPIGAGGPGGTPAFARLAAVERPLALRPFGPDDLAVVEPWFADGETQRWLGGPEWPLQALRLASAPLGEFRGARETGRFDFIGWQSDVPVGYIGCGTVDRWTTWEGGPGGRGVVEAIEVPAAAVAYVVDPARRRLGHCSAMLSALMARPELAAVQLFGGGVEEGNVASVRCLEVAGWRRLHDEPDWEGYLYYVRRRPGGGG